MIADLITAATVTVLAVIALVHFYWAFGGKTALAYALPSRDGVPLFRPGKWMTFGVGLLLFGFALVAYLLRFADPQGSVGGAYLPYAGWAISALFLLRALGEFKAVGFFKTIKDSAFARYDTLLYSPLCLCLGFVFWELASAYNETVAS